MEQLKPIFYAFPNDHGDNLVMVCLKYINGFTTRGLSICSPEEPDVDIVRGMKIAEGRANWAYGTAVKQIVEDFGLHIEKIAKFQLRRFGQRHGNEIIRDEAKLIMYECRCPFTKKAYWAPRLTPMEQEMVHRVWGSFTDF